MMKKMIQAFRYITTKASIILDNILHGIGMRFPNLWDFIYYITYLDSVLWLKRLKKRVAKKYGAYNFRNLARYWDL